MYYIDGDPPTFFLGFVIASIGLAIAFVLLKKEPPYE